MKKQLLAIILMFITWMAMQAQSDTLLLHYSSPRYDDPFIENLVKLQDVSQLRVTISGDSLKGRKLIYRCHRVLNGVSTEIRRFPIPIPVKNDCVKFLFGARAVSPDSVVIALDGPVRSRGGERVATSGHILMETYPEQAFSVSDTIPIVAYTTGIPYKTTFSGQVAEGVDYCGLRDSRVHPQEWYGKYAIDDFIYYDIIFLP